MKICKNYNENVVACEYCRKRNFSTNIVICEKKEILETDNHCCLCGKKVNQEKCIFFWKYYGVVCEQCESWKLSECEDCKELNLNSELHNGKCRMCAEEKCACCGAELSLCKLERVYNHPEGNYICKYCFHIFSFETVQAQKREDHEEYLRIHYPEAY